MTDGLQISKQKFLCSLAKLSKGSPSTLSSSELFLTTDEFLSNVFDFCRHQGPVNLNDTDEQLVGSQMSAALTTIESGLYAAFRPLDPDQRQTAKLYRSAVQFLVDDFRNLIVDDDAPGADSEAKRKPSSERLAELLNCGPVESLDDNLVCWEDDGALGEFPCNSPPIDVTGVPSSHKWWNEYDRNVKS